MTAARVSTLVANHHAGGLRRTLGGIAMGAACGFGTYWSGAALASAVDLIHAPAGEAMRTLLRPFYVVTLWELALVLVGAVVGGFLSRYRWRLAGLLGYVALVSLIAGYLLYAATVAIPRVPPGQRWVSALLLVGEVGGLGLIVIFSFYSLDAAARRRWRRVAAQRPYDPDLRPSVALMVPVFNEPLAMVRQTILHLLNQEYPRRFFRVLVLDDSTDPELRTRLAAFCKSVGARYIQRPDRRGFKAGAINHAASLLPPSVELIGVVDADYWVQPDYLKSLVGYFVDPDLSFVQTPQDYRNIGQSFLTRQYKRAESYFYHGIMPSRNEQSTIIFCGTMGLLRRRAMDQVGGFGEDQICEDAEISVRLAIHGWDSLYVGRSFGHGLMPAVFEAYKKQFHRWAFGNVRILTSRSAMILRSTMTRRQKLDFLASNLHWFDGLFVAIIAGTLLYLGLGPVLGYNAVTHHQRELALLALVPFFLVVDGLLHLHTILSRSQRIHVGQTLLVQGMWFAIKFTNLRAALKSLLGFRAPFVRTPKEPGRMLGRTAALLRAIRVTNAESLIGSIMIFVAILNILPGIRQGSGMGGMLLPAWLCLYGLFFLCAPIYAYLSYRTLLPSPGIPETEQAPKVARRSAANRTP